MSWDNSLDIDPATRRSFLSTISTTIEIVDDDIVTLHTRKGWKATPLITGTAWKLMTSQDSITSLQFFGASDVWALSLETLDGERRLARAVLSERPELQKLARRYAPFNYIFFFGTSSHPDSIIGAALSLTSLFDYDIMVAREELFNALDLSYGLEAFQRFADYLRSTDATVNRPRPSAVSDMLQRYNAADSQTAITVSL